MKSMIAQCNGYRMTPSVFRVVPYKPEILSATGHEIQSGLQHGTIPISFHVSIIDEINEQTHASALCCR